MKTSAAAPLHLLKTMRVRGAGLAAFTVVLLGACGGGGGNGGTGSGGAGGSVVCTSCVNGATLAPVQASVSGIVLDSGGQPVPGVTVSVFHHNDHSTVTATTDANGIYTVSGLSTLVNADYAIYATKPGLGFLARGDNAAATVSKFDFMGLYRTVIRFAALPAHDVSGANFIALRAGERVASLPRTGQVQSYASGDDPALQRGVAWPAGRFADNQDGTVTDRLTGLVWLKNAGCYGPANWADALAAANVLAAGTCGLSDGSVAGQWRMPNANELESLVDVSQANPAVSGASPFVNIHLGTAYWTSTTYTAANSNAMAIRFTDGRWINGHADAQGNIALTPGAASFNNDKASAVNALWAVKSGSAGAVQLLATGVYDAQGGHSFGPRDDANLQIGAPLTSVRFIDNGDGTLADTVTGLTWLKKADCINQNWSDALASVNNLASGQCGLTDGSTSGQWRMPNRAEMLSISDRAPTFPQASYLNGQYQANTSINGPVIFNNFIVADYYWTSTTDAADPNQAWSVYSCDFGVYNIAKTTLRYTLAVR